MPIVFFLTVSLLFLSVTHSVSEEMSLGDDLLTLSIGEVQAISVVFSALSNRDDRSQFSSEQVLPYLYTFIQKCERFVLEKGSFPYDLSVHIFDQQFASAVGASDSTSTFYSQLAIYLLWGAWWNSVTLDMESFSQITVHDLEESFNLILAYSEAVYVSSAILSALMDDPHRSLSNQLGVSVDVLFPVPKRRRNVADRFEQEQIQQFMAEVKTDLLFLTEGISIAVTSFVMALSVFLIMFLVNIFSVVIIFFAMR